MERILQQRYKIVRSLGRGGLGAVFLCDDLRLPGRQWALKQMNSPRPELFEKFRESFSREASTLSQLSHPNLPDIIDYFEEDNELFLVMEYVEGENFGEYVRRRGPLTEAEAFKVGLTIANILIYLHQLDPPVIFRDLKPENVMITTDRRIKLIDFGLARYFAPEKRSDTVPSGSVGYAAPEQWEDQTQTDGRSDIYSWGATILYLLSGKVPSPVFPMSLLPRPTAKDGPYVSDRARTILDRCVRSRPADRYANAAELAHAVSELIGNVSTELAPGVPSTSGEGQTMSTREITTRDRRRTTDLRNRPPQRSRLRDKIGRMFGRSATAPLALLVVATVAWFAALAFALPRQTPLPSASPSPPATAQGVPPYRQLLASAARREQAKRLYRQQKWTEAIALLDQLTTETPEDAELQVLAQNAYVHISGSPYLTIPFIESNNGTDAFDSFAHLYGLALGQATINKRGGIRGKKIVVDLYDDESQVSKCLEIAQLLTRNPNTLVVLGPTSSQRTIAVAPIFNAAHVSLVAPTASSEKVWEAGPYIFTASDSRTPRVRALADYEVDNGVKSAAIVVDRTSRLSGEMADTFAAEMARHGVQTRRLPTFEDGQTDFSEQVQAVTQTHPELVFFSDYKPATMGAFARQLRATGSTVKLCSQTISFSFDLIDQGGGAVDGLVLCEYFHPQLDTPAMRAFMAAFRRKFGDLTPPYAVANTFDAFNAVAEALENADTREGVRDYLASSGRTRPAFDGVSGRFAFGRRLDARPLWLLEVRHGRFRLLEDRPRSVVSN